MPNPNGPEGEGRRFAPVIDVVEDPDILWRTTLGRSVCDRIEEAMGHRPLPIDLTKGTLSPGGVDADLHQFRWNVRETEGGTDGRPKIDKSLGYSFGTHSLAGKSVVHIPTASRPVDVRWLKRDVSLALWERKGQWHPRPLTTIVASWRGETVSLHFPSGNNQNTLVLNFHENGSYYLVAKFATEPGELDITAALDPDSDYWETPDGVPTADAIKVQELFGVSSELLKGWDGSKLPALMHHALVAAQPTTIASE